VADRVLMLENSIYSVISPEGCAAIMWKDPNKKQQAAAALRYTATDVLRLGCVDDVLAEPQGGTHIDPAAALSLVDERLQFHFGELLKMGEAERLEQRYSKFRNIAQFYTSD
jgi:acetyl-CoA carboxylase carboxyl transferase subunit alpha